ncbi:hypothetical protein [Flavilitoribacter nigricans]|uniref:DUF3311 domain-containing protein n=1 Tax=Flavilitoribacter nigricans (strain ATCC 23147 / DSM 23189 / NBRC 102662 / NCIMB 1420 / SS-2) TaxID=1122177 RepID=A0A2D0NET3_FLAN2|nr:hypothetical protein [Flavilitoribacter nigricans]PHN06293.1 hypothetical protein CRP01_12020 [Flavilitoribacter nigricans DSM 23189 = NBRC 102662]
MKNDKLIWRICCGLAILLMVLAFSPVFIPTGVFEPKLFGMPYTLWSGIAVCIAMVLITYVATLVHPGRRDPLFGDRHEKN